MAIEELSVGIFDETGTPITGGSVDTSIKIRRSIDGYLLDWNDSVFKNVGWGMLEDTLIEVDSVSLPGYYNKNIDMGSWDDGKYLYFIDYFGSFDGSYINYFFVGDGKMVEQNILVPTQQACSSALALYDPATGSELTTARNSINTNITKVEKKVDDNQALIIVGIR